MMTVINPNHTIPKTTTKADVHTVYTKIFHAWILAVGTIGRRGNKECLITVNKKEVRESCDFLRCVYSNQLSKE